MGLNLPCQRHSSDACGSLIISSYLRMRSNFELHWRVICLGYLLCSLYHYQLLRSFLWSPAIFPGEGSSDPRLERKCHTAIIPKPWQFERAGAGFRKQERSSAFSYTFVLNPYFPYVLMLADPTTPPKILTSSVLSEWGGGRGLAVRIGGRDLGT